MSNPATSAVTTHVLDTALGVPASGVPVRLEHLRSAGSADESPRPVAEAVTDTDGRATGLGPDRLEPGTYRLTFDTGSYFASQGRHAFYPEVVVTVTLGEAVDGGQGHYHLPLLLAPYSYSTYRGS